MYRFTVKEERLTEMFVTTMNLQLSACGRNRKCYIIKVKPIQ